MCHGRRCSCCVDHDHGNRKKTEYVANVGQERLRQRRTSSYNRNHSVTLGITGSTPYFLITNSLMLPKNVKKILQETETGHTHTNTRIGYTVYTLSIINIINLDNVIMFNITVTVYFVQIFWSFGNIVLETFIPKSPLNWIKMKCLSLRVPFRLSSPGKASPFKNLCHRHRQIMKNVNNPELQYDLEMK